MRIENYVDWYNNTGKEYNNSHKRNMYFSWKHQQAKIDEILEFISLLGQQKELDHFLKDEYGRE